MFRRLPVFVALASSLLSSAAVPSLRASVPDKKTFVAVSRPMAVQAIVLKLLKSPTNRNIVQIYNAEETRLRVSTSPGGQQNVLIGAAFGLRRH
jgi:hypothetical protein